MPKFKLGNIVARVFLEESWRERSNTDYLHAEFGRYLSESYRQAHSRTASDNDDDDDGSSIISTSSTATADDLPGTGRILDMCVFQPMGRRIERLAMRFTIASLHPSCIAQYIGSDVFTSFNDPMTLHYAIANLCSSQRNGSTVVAGMKGLVKQTQSDSIDRSAAALAALIRVSLGFRRKEVYANISRVEPIFQLETLVRSHPDKKWFLFLVKLARETLIAIRVPSPQNLFDPLLGTEVLQLWPSQETAQNLRQRLLRVLKVYGLSGLDSLDETIGEACAICAEAVSTYIDSYARGDAYMHILDTVYFTVIFILRSIYELADLARITNSKHIYMVLRTLACWMDAIVYKCIDSAESCFHRYDMDLLEVAIAFRSLVLVDADTKYMLLPESFGWVWRNELFFNNGFPRRNREGNKYIHHIESLIEAAKQRTRRLLRSFDALEIEAWGCTSQTNSCTTQLEIIADPHWILLHNLGDEWWKGWKITLERARRVQVQAISLTEEFREARRIGLECDPADGKKWRHSFDRRNWAYYQLRRASRHKWGQYFRSNMDWDRDLGTCMKRLFKVEKQTSPPGAHTPRASSHDVDVAAGPGGTLNITMGEAQECLLKEVRVAYKTKTGETRYMSFVPAFPGPGGHTNTETAGSGSSSVESFNPVAAQQGLGYGKGSSKEELEIEDTGSISSDDGRLVDCESVLFAESVGDIEGRQLPYDIGSEGVRAGGEDVISICSLD